MSEVLSDPGREAPQVVRRRSMLQMGPGLRAGAEDLFAAEI